MDVVEVFFYHAARFGFPNAALLAKEAHGPWDRVYRTLFEYATCEHDYFRLHFARKRPRLHLAYQQVSADLSALADDLAALALPLHAAAAAAAAGGAATPPGSPRAAAAPAQSTPLFKRVSVLISPSSSAPSTPVRAKQQPQQQQAGQAGQGPQHGPECEGLHAAEVVLRELVLLVQTRAEAIALYRRLAEQQRPASLAPVADRMSQAYSAIEMIVNSTTLTHARRHMQLELAALNRLALAEVEIGELRHVPAAMSLKAAHDALDEWHELYATLSSTSPGAKRDSSTGMGLIQRSGIFGSATVPSAQWPENKVHTFLCTWLQHLLCKASLYFHHALQPSAALDAPLVARPASTQLSPSSSPTRDREARKQPVDYVAKFEEFAARSGALAVVVVFRSRDPAWSADGYTCPPPSQQPQRADDGGAADDDAAAEESSGSGGKEYWHVVFHTPTARGPAATLELLPDVVRLLEEHREELQRQHEAWGGEASAQQQAQAVTGLDESSGARVGYALEALEANVFLAVLLRERRADKDRAVSEFVGTTARLLRMWEAFRFLKTAD
eukprot:m51a1_g8115 hypothetical protein (558) ;mRNA; f:137918-140426